MHIHPWLKRIHPAHLLFLLVVALGVAFPESIESFFIVSTRFVMERFGWLIMILSSLCVCVCGYLGFSRYGHIRLGHEDEHPSYSTASWLAMLFAAGMGTGLVFYGAAEPLIHYLQPPAATVDASNINGNVAQAMAITYYHWGIHAWCIYALGALVIAYFTFRHDRPMLPSSAITHRPAYAAMINSVAILSVIFGVVATMSQGILQLSEGMAYVFDWPISQTPWVQMTLLAVLVCAYMLSASTGLHKGIKLLSDSNMLLAMALMLFVLGSANSLFIVDLLTSAIGQYLDQFMRLSFNTRHLSEHPEWLWDWTLTYLIWWIAWTPFVGVFIARISRGRTIRSFLLGVVMAPTGFSAIWFATLGGAAIHEVLEGSADFARAIAQPQQTTYALLETLPMAEITMPLTMLLLCIFIITSADSGTYVLSIFTSYGERTPPVSERLFWGVMIGVVTAGAVYSNGGTNLFRAIAVFGGIPYLGIMVWQTLAFMRHMIRHECLEMRSKAN